MTMNYTHLNCKRRRSARIQSRSQSRSMDRIPEALYQDIFSYLLEDNFQDIFLKNYSLQFINKTFQRSFIRYLNKKPLNLFICNWKHVVEFTLQIIKFLKRYDISVYDMTIDFNIDDDDYCPPSIIMEAMYGINFTFLKRLELYSDGRHFDLKILGCKELTHFTLGDFYANALDEDQRTAEKLKTFLSFNKHTLEYLKYHVVDVETYNDIFPKDLSWPNLKKITLSDIRISTSLTIESSTLQHLVLHIYPIYSIGEMVIRCPNLKVLLIDAISSENSFGMELTDRSCKPYDNHENYTETCHPSELRKIGLVVDVCSDCDIGIWNRHYFL